MAMVNMQQSAEESQEANEPAVADAPKYPYGLELRLDEEALAKLGMDKPPAVGTEMMISAKVVVTSASQYQTQDGEAEASSCWQITDMEMSGSPSNGNAADKLYGGSSD